MSVVSVNPAVTAVNAAITVRNRALSTLRRSGNLRHLEAAHVLFEGANGTIVELAKKYEEAAVVAYQRGLRISEG